MFSDSVTAVEIASMIESATGRTISKRRIQSRKGIDQFVVGQESRGGRPAKLYSIEAIKLWLGSMAETSETASPKPERKRRADCSQPRKCTPSDWTVIVTRVKGIFMSSAQPNLRYACEEAVRQLRAEGMTIELNVYRRLFNKATDRASGLRLSEFWRDNWKAQHSERFYKLRHRHSAVHTNDYEWCKFFENAGWAGPGFGAGRVWVIDGRSSDAWARTSDSRDPRSMVLPNALYIRDGLTGYPLWVEPIQSESADAVKTALLKCMIYWQRVPDIGVAIDGGIAMTAVDTKQIISRMLPDDAWDRAANFPDFFGSTCEPVLINLPYQPNCGFKALLERGNRQIKDEYDDPRHAIAYQGGTRAEAVQLRVSNQPTVTAATPHIDTFFDDMRAWLYSTYVHRERPRSDLRHVTRYGIPATLEAAFTYYGGHTESAELPRDERLATILYWFTLRMPDRRAIGRVKGAGVRPTKRIGGEEWPVVCEGLTFRHQGEKVAVIPIPGDALHAVVMHLLGGDERRPQFVGIGVRTSISDPAHVGYQRAATTANRKRYLAELRAEMKTTAPARYQNFPTPESTDDREVPRTALPTWLDTPATAPRLPADPASALACADEPIAEEPIEISDDVYNLLRRTKSLR